MLSEIVALTHCFNVVTSRSNTSCSAIRQLQPAQREDICVTFGVAWMALDLARLAQLGLGICVLCSANIVAQLLVYPSRDLDQLISLHQY
jgi:hypothetical protein